MLWVACTGVVVVAALYILAPLFRETKDTLDIELLAENGYGEDNSGNNIPLPEQLTYLRQ